jgi:phytol kinase
MLVIATCIAVFIVLCVAEFGWRRGWLKNEFGRKFVHILVGTFVAFWPLFLTWDQIVLLSIAFVVVVAISKYDGILTAIHSVQRPTWGEVFFAITVGALAAVTHDGWIYMTALLHMSLADGFAAILGLRYGKSNRYKVLGHPKSMAGTLTFFVISLVILLGYTIGTGYNIALPAILGIALVATALENVSIKGLDNLTVPFWIAVMLNWLS